MTTIACDIRDSLGSPLSGFVQVTLDYWLADDDTSYLTVPAQVPVVAGLATLELEPSDLAKVTYHFEIFQTGTPPVLLRSFRAVVPDSATPISLNDLAQTTGITRDAQTSAIGAVTRRLYNLPDFWNAARSNLFAQKGAFSATGFYKAGDVVRWEGSSYVCVSPLSITGVFPSDAARWQIWAAKGDPGTGIQGNPTAYSAAGWLNATDAPSRGAIRELVETLLATKNDLQAKADNTDGVMIRPRIFADPPTFDNTNRIPSTQWVQTLINQIARAQTPVGSVIAYTGSAAPTSWLLCDGRAVSRTTFSALFALLSTVYGNGDGSTTFNLPDLRGRVPVAPDSSLVTGSANRVPSAVLGGVGGAASVTLNANNLPAHNHNGQSGGSYWHQLASGGAFALTFGAGTTANVFNTTGVNATTNAPVDNLQPYQVLNYIIYTGV